MKSRATVSAVLDDIGIGTGRIAACSPLTGGTYNAVTRVTLTDGRDWVVKIPPPTTAAAMSYERDLLVNEVTFYSAAAATGDVAVPGVVHSRLDPGSATGPYLIMSACPGQPWYGISPAWPTARSGGSGMNWGGSSDGCTQSPGQADSATRPRRWARWPRPGGRRSPP